MQTTDGSRTWEQLRVAELLDSLADGAYVTDTSRRILYWNDAATYITGWKRQEVVGRRCADNVLVHIDKDGHPLCGAEYCPLHRSIVTGQPSAQPVLVFASHKNGSRVPVEVTVSPLCDAEGRIVGGIELFRDVSHHHEDLRRARLIQQQLLHQPPFDPRMAAEVRYVPQDHVGGDYFRVERTSPDSFAVLIADVTGHGVASALYTMQLHTLWEEQRRLWHEPADALTALNERLSPLAGDQGFFATAAALHVRIDTGDFLIALAGHPAPLLFRSRCVERPGRAQPALGMIDRIEYTAESGRMERGDLLLCFTDGALEIPDPRGEELGEAGLERVCVELRSQHSGTLPLPELEERLLKHSTCIRLNDDLSLLTLRMPHHG